MTQRRTHTRSSRSHAGNTRTRHTASPNGDRPKRSERNATSLSRGQSENHYFDQHKRRQRKKALKRILLAIVILLATLGVAAAIFIFCLSSRLSVNIDDNLRKQLVPVEPGKPFYMLLLGTDKASWRESDYGASDSNYRTDSMILARVDPNNCQVTLVSLHRDTLVDLGPHGKQKINAAYSFGGAGYSVEVVSKLAGVPISHYAEINFDSFCSIVDQIGGIEVNVPINIKDNVVGFSLKAGRQTLNGDDALNLCRSRHGYDAYGDGDMYRAANQRMVIGAILKKILKLDIPSMIATISSLTESVRTDMNLIEIVSLAEKMKSLDPKQNMYTGMEPTTSKYINGICYEILDTAKWKKMMKRVDEGLSPYASEKEDPTHGLAGAKNAIKNSGASPSGSTGETLDGTVTVQNNAGVNKLASRYAGVLAQSGYQTSTTTGSTTTLKTSIIVYANNNKKSAAQDIASKLDLSVEPIKNDGSYKFSTDILVILGKDAVSTPIARDKKAA